MQLRVSPGSSSKQKTSMQIGNRTRQSNPSDSIFFVMTSVEWQLGRETPLLFGRLSGSGGFRLIPCSTSTRNMSEHQQVSYAFFCRVRPFWVVPPTDRDRETCQCKTHENLQFMADKLFRLGISKSRNIEEMSDCNTSKTCAYGDCSECKLSTYPLSQSSNKDVTLTQRCHEKVNITQGEETRQSTITVK